MQRNISHLRHQLRTPLNHLIGYSQLLLEDAQAPDDIRLRRNIEEVAGLSKDLLKLIENGLGQARGDVSEANVTGLREKLLAPARKIQQITKSMDGSPVQQRASDIGKLDLAISHLIELIESGEIEHTIVLEPPAKVQEKTAVETSEKETSTAHLLVADDNAGNRDVLARMLQSLGYQVSMAVDGSEALQILEHNHYDLLLLDILMPKMNGYAVLEALQAANQEIPVIVISAVGDMESVVRCIEMGAEDYLFKPFNPTLLRARIKAALDRKKYRERLVLQERLACLGELMLGVAHEMRNPLNFVNNFAGLSIELMEDVRDRLGPSSEAAEDLLHDLEQNLDKIQQHGRRAEQIVQRMLSHSRNHADQRGTIEINTLIAEYAKLAWHGFRSSHPEFDMNLATDYDPKAGTITGFRADLGRVIINIVSNACYSLQQKMKAAPDFCPTISILTRNMGAAVEVLIQDNGDGIPPNIQKEIFKPFFTTKPAGAGTGLGLSISFDIVVRGHGGQLTARSEPGRFTEFLIRLPRS